MVVDKNGDYGLNGGLVTSYLVAVRPHIRQRVAILYASYIS